MHAPTPTIEALNALGQDREPGSPLEVATTACRTELAANYRLLADLAERTAAALDAGGNAIELSALLAEHGILERHIGAGLEQLGSLYGVAGSA